MTAGRRVVIAEDSVLLLAGLTKLLESAGFEVAATAADAESLLAAVEREQPDVVIADVRMPPTHTDEGIRAALVIRSEWPEVAVLVLSQYVEERYAADLLSANTRGVGYLLKDRVADVAEFLDALRRVAAGGTALDPEVVAQLLVRRGGDPLDNLTERELGVLALMVEGAASPEPGIEQRGQLIDVLLDQVGQRPFRFDQTGSTGYSSGAYAGSWKTVSQSRAATSSRIAWLMWVFGVRRTTVRAAAGARVEEPSAVVSVNPCACRPGGRGACADRRGQQPGRTAISAASDTACQTAGHPRRACSRADPGASRRPQARPDSSGSRARRQVPPCDRRARLALPSARRPAGRDLHAHRSGQQTPSGSVSHPAPTQTARDRASVRADADRPRPARLQD